MFEDRETKIARAVRAGPAGPASSRAYVSLVTFFAPKKVTISIATLRDMLARTRVFLILAHQ